jgi:hypothetical protein
MALPILPGYLSGITRQGDGTMEPQSGSTEAIMMSRGYTVGTQGLGNMKSPKSEKAQQCR